MKLNVGEVAPGTRTNDVPPLVLTIHWMVGIGRPVAAAVNVAVFPAVSDKATGLVVITGKVFTVSVAAVVVALLVAFVNTALY